MSKLPKLPRVLGTTGRGGMRRPVLLGATALALIGGVFVVSSLHHTTPPASKTARLGEMNTLPGGAQTDPQQEALARQGADEGAARAKRDGTSFTPPIGPARPQGGLEVGDTTPPPVAEPPAPDKPVHPVAAVERPPVAVDARFAAPPSSGNRSAADAQASKLYGDAVSRVLSQWGGRSPTTELAMATVIQHDPAGSDDPQRPSQGVVPPPRSESIADRAAVQDSGQVLIPAGRGVYAHTVVAVDNDIGGQIVLQADSGPIAGDRMLGTFSKAGGHENLLVVFVTSVVHRGEQIPANGMVIAPQTMQTAVASSVDQHYFSRFVLPAAAAFVQGLGQALATTSNTVGQLGPLGNTSYVTSLNFPQQVGVGAGAAAQTVGSALNQAAPTGPTIHLDANANVGVIFTSDVKTKGTAN